MNPKPLSFKHEINPELVACRACLCTDRKMFNIHNSQLLHSYSNLTGIEVSPYDMLPQYLCNYCSTLLAKFSSFKDHCQKSKIFLEQARQNNQEITTEYLSKYPKFFQFTVKSLFINVNSTLKQLILSTKDGKTPIIRTDDNSDSDCNDFDNSHENDQRDSHDHFDDYKSSSSEDDKKDQKIFAQSIKIEQEDENDIPLAEIKKKIAIVKTKKKIFETPVIKRRPKYFETKQNMNEFEKAWDVDIIILSKEQQMKEILDRKMGKNYLHSPYKCELCYKGFMDQDTLDRHVLHQHDPSKGDSVCEFCKYRYKNSRDLTQHIRNLHRLKFACRQCSNVTKFVFKAKEHFKKEHGGEKYQCQHCGKTYQKLSSHLSHLRIHHPSEFVWCELCGEAFLGEKGLNSHNHKTHRNLCLPHECECGKKFLTPEALTTHRTYNNCSDKCCCHCGQGFALAMGLRDHLLEKHKKDKVITCQKCNKHFSSEVTYCGHYRRFHVETSALAQCARAARVPWVCHLCGKELASIQGFNVHMRVHNRERPFKCSVCPKTYGQMTLLQIHTRVHTGERPFECQLCPKTFSNKPALQRHIRVHTGDKPYECPHCGKAFSQSNSRKLHVNTVHLKMPAPYKSRRRRTEKSDDFLHDSTMPETSIEDTASDNMYDKFKKRKLCPKT